MGLLLFITSLVLKRILEPFMYLYGSIIAVSKGEWNKYHKELALSIDQYGNGLSRYLFNQVLIKKESKHKFGNIDETISSVIGKNKLDDTLTWLGNAVDFMLDIIQPNHSLNSIDNSEN